MRGFVGTVGVTVDFDGSGNVGGLVAPVGVLGLVELEIGVLGLGWTNSVGATLDHWNLLKSNI